MFAHIDNESLAAALGIASVELRPCGAPALTARIASQRDEATAVTEEALSDGAAISIRRASGNKCGRCWRQCNSVPREGALCYRCENVTAGVEL